MPNDTRENLISLLHKKVQSPSHDASKILRKESLKASAPVELCNIMNSEEPLAVRACAASTLAHCLATSGQWARIPLRKQDEIRQKLLDALHASAGGATKKIVYEISRALAHIMMHDAAIWLSETTISVFDRLLIYCLSVDGAERHLGTSTFYFLAKFAPAVYVRHVHCTLDIFIEGMEVAESKPNCVYKLLSAWARIIPLTYNRLQHDCELAKSVSVIICAACGSIDVPAPKTFMRAFDMLHSIYVEAPGMIGPKMSLLLYQTLTMVTYAPLNADMHVKALSFARLIIMQKCQDELQVSQVDEITSMLLYAMQMELDNDEDKEREFSATTSYVVAMSKFAIGYWRAGEFEAAKRLFSSNLTQMLYHVRGTTSLHNATLVMHFLGRVLITMAPSALEAQRSAQMIFSTVRTALSRRLRCQRLSAAKAGTHERGTESLMEKKSELMQTACDLLAAFGHAMTPQQFRPYFKQIARQFLPRLRNLKPKDQFSEKRAFVYGVLARCLVPLDLQANHYMEIFDKTIIEALQDEFKKVREHAMGALVDVIDYIEEQQHYLILKKLTFALSDAIKASSQLELHEKETATKALSRLLLLRQKHMSASQ